jgi:quercetin dioxygenase-like cupin family protein
VLVQRLDEQSVAQWREGVTTRLAAAASTGAQALCVIEQRCAPGAGAPLHSHPNAEEAIVVLEGTVEFRVGEERAVLGVGDTIVLPRGVAHLFTNTGEGDARILAAFSSAAPVADYAGSDTLEIGAGEGVRKDAHRVYVRE